MSELAMRPYAAADRDAVLALRARVFGTADMQRERRCWQWEYDDNPFRTPSIPLGWIAELDGAMVGFYGMVPLPAFIDGARTLALCGADFCVDQQHRNAGIGFRLTRQFLETPGAALRIVMSATPTAAALMRYYGALAIDVVGERCLQVATDWSRGERGNGGPSGLEVHGDFDLHGEADLARLDTFSAKLAASHRVMLARDGRYFAWRYARFPLAEARPVPRCLRGAGGELRGMAVFQHDVSLRRAYLLELLHAPDDRAACEALVRDALALAGAAGARELYAFHRVPTALAALAACGFAAVPVATTLPVATLPLAPSSGRPSLADWYVAPGDGDFLYRLGTTTHQ